MKKRPEIPDHYESLKTLSDRDLVITFLAGNSILNGEPGATEAVRDRYMKIAQAVFAAEAVDRGLHGDRVKSLAKEVEDYVLSARKHLYN